MPLKIWKVEKSQIFLKIRDESIIIFFYTGTKVSHYKKYDF
jgi:hypothetical protein